MIGTCGAEPRGATPSSRGSGKISICRAIGVKPARM
jgi:hypothetical protein